MGGYPAKLIFSLWQMIFISSLGAPPGARLLHHMSHVEVTDGAADLSRMWQG